MQMKHLATLLSLLCLLFVHSVVSAQQPKLVIPSGHMHQIKDAFFSNNEQFIITWSENIKIWETATGKLVKNIDYKQAPRDVYLFKNNEVLAVAYDDSIQFWNINEDRLIRTMAGNNFNVYESGNAFIAMHFDDDHPNDAQNARLYDSRTFELKFTFSLPLASAAYKKYIAVDFGKTVIYDSAFREIYRVTDGDIAGISDDYTYLAVLKDTTLRFINTNTGKLLHTLKVGKLDQYDVRFFPDLNRILIKVTPNDDKDHSGYVGQNGNAHFYAVDMQTMAVTHRFPEQKGNLEEWSFRGNVVAASFRDSTIRMWDIKTGKLMATMKDPTGFSSKISLSNSKQLIIASSSTASARIWDVNQQKLKLQLEENVSYIKKNHFSPNGQLALTQRSEDVWIWNITTGKPVINYTAAPGRTTTNCGFSKDNQLAWMFTRQFGKTTYGEGVTFSFSFNDSQYAKLLVYNLSSGMLQRTLSLPENIFRHAVSPDARSILLGLNDSSLLLMDITTGKIKWKTKLSSTASDVDYIDDGKLCIVVNDKHFSIYNTVSGTVENTVTEEKSIASYGYDVTTGIAVIMLENKKLLVHDVKANKIVYEYAGTQQAIRTAFNKEAYPIVIDATHTYAYAGGVVDSLVAGIHLKTGATNKSISLRTYSAQLGFNSNNNLLLRFTGGEVVEWSVKNDEVIQVKKLDVEYIDDFHPSDKYILGHTNTAVRLIDHAKEKSLYGVFFLPRSNYIITDAATRFDGSETARRQLYLSCGTELIELDQVKDQLWVPNLAERIMKAEKINTPAINDLNICGLTPIVANQSTGNQYSFFIQPRNGGLGESRLYVNGIEVKRFLPAQLNKINNGYTLNIPATQLQPYFISGKENTVTVRAFTASNDVSSRGFSIPVKAVAVNQALPTLYAVMVGVSDYKGDELDLKYAAKDAQDLSNAVASSARKLLNTDGKEHVVIYNINTDPQRTAFPEKKAIQKVFDEISTKARPNDILLMFFAGHGVMQGEKKQFYFLTADASANSDISITGISINELNEWMKPEKIKAQKRVLIFDACNSGQAINDLVTIGKKDDQYVAARNDEESNRIKAVEKLNERSGMFILSASASNQYAYELGKFSQGVLTYSLLKTIKEQPDILDDGRYLNVDKWFAATEKMVSEIVAQTGNRQQPQKFGAGGFNVGVVDNEVITKIILPQEKPLFTASNFQNSDEAVAYDDMELSKTVNQQLNTASARGTEGKVLYITGSNSPDAYTLSGRYDVKGNDITVRVNIIRNKQIVHRFEVKGNKEEMVQLAQQIVRMVETWATR